MIPRFSLKQLLIFIAFASVACAALARPGHWWHATVVTAVAMTAVGMLIVALESRQKLRAFAVGWLVMAVGYLAVVLGPWSAQHLAPQLLTSKGLARLESIWHKNQPSPPVFGYAVSDADGDGLTDVWIDSGQPLFRQPVGGSGTVVWNNNTGALLQPPATTSTAPWTVFQATGHWLLAIVLGYCGGRVTVALLRYRGSLAH